MAAGTEHGGMGGTACLWLPATLEAEILQGAVPRWGDGTPILTPGVQASLLRSPLPSLLLLKLRGLQPGRTGEQAVTQKVL